MASIVSRSRIFANHNDVWALPHGALKRGLKRMGIRPDPCLVNNRLLMAVNKISRVFKRYDLARGITVPMVNHRCQLG